MSNPDRALGFELPDGVRVVASVRHARGRAYDVQSRAYVRGLDSRLDIQAARDALPKSTPRGEDPAVDRAYNAFNRMYAAAAKEYVNQALVAFPEHGLVLTERYGRFEIDDTTLVFKHDVTGSHIMLGGHLYERRREGNGRHLATGAKRDLWVLLPAPVAAAA